MKLLYIAFKVSIGCVNVVYRNLWAFSLGFVLGVVLALLYASGSAREPAKRGARGEEEYGSWLKEKGWVEGPSEAELLFREVPLMCLVFVRKASNAYALLNTWGKRCNSLHFFGQQKHSFLNITTFEYMSSWRFLCESLRHIWTEHREDMRWVLFAYDNLYVIPENLRYFLATKNPDENYYLGHNSAFWNQEYNSADAGYVLSRGAIKTLLKKFNTTESCRAPRIFLKKEDYYLG